MLSGLVRYEEIRTSLHQTSGRVTVVQAKLEQVNAAYNEATERFDAAVTAHNRTMKEKERLESRHARAEITLNNRLEGIQRKRIELKTALAQIDTRLVVTSKSRNLKQHRDEISARKNRLLASLRKLNKKGARYIEQHRKLGEKIHALTDEAIVWCERAIESREELNSIAAEQLELRKLYNECLRVHREQIREFRTYRPDRHKYERMKYAVAQTIGIDQQYYSSMEVRVDAEGSIHFYFGEKAHHGHYALNTNGEITYRRDPHQAHGPQNFTPAEKRRSIELHPSFS